MSEPAFVRVLTKSYTEHYFHFLYGYLIPFVIKAEKSNDVVYLFDSCGPPMNDIIRQMRGYKVDIYRGQKIDKKIMLPSYDSPDFSGLDFGLARERMFSMLEEDMDSTKRQILFVARARPHSFYIEKAKIKDSGASRRSVPNMHEAFELVSSRFPSRMVELENMPMCQQVATFRDSSCVVLQHGAAMGNLLWCRPGTSVVEIGNDEETKYYEKLVCAMRLRRKIVGHPSPHSKIDASVVAKVALKLSVIF